MRGAPLPPAAVGVSDTCGRPSVDHGKVTGGRQLDARSVRRRESTSWTRPSVPPRSHCPQLASSPAGIAGYFVPYEEPGALDREPRSRHATRFATARSHSAFLGPAEALLTFLHGASPFSHGLSTFQ